MSKRYTDKDIWEKEWFLKLSNDEKAAWFYIKDKCDNAGVWTPNFTLANFILGEIDWNSLPDKLNNNVEILENGKWFIKDFCKFQYTNLSEESKSIPIQSHIKLLKEHGLWERVSKGLPKVSQRLNKALDKALPKLKDKDKEKDKDIDKYKDKEKETELYNKIKNAFESRYGDFDNYAKEGQHIYNIIKRAKARSPDYEIFIKSMLEAFWKLKSDGNSFWQSQPFLPSILDSNSIWPRVLETLRDNQIPEPKEINH